MILGMILGMILEISETYIDHWQLNNSILWIFEKASGCQVFKRFNFGSKIVEMLHKCCCSVDFLKEIAFCHVVRAN